LTSPASEKAQEEPPAKLLDDLFRKTKAAPCIYWLPLTDSQVSTLLQGESSCDYWSGSRYWLRIIKEESKPQRKKAFLRNWWWVCQCLESGCVNQASWNLILLAKKSMFYKFFHFSALGLEVCLKQ
jgi:hypothetical protein